MSHVRSLNTVFKEKPQEFGPTTYSIRENYFFPFFFISKEGECFIVLFVFALVFQRMITHTLQTKLMFNGPFYAQRVFKLVFAPGLLSKHSPCHISPCERASGARQ